MPDLSPFQTLPIHIAEAIGYYCIGLQRHRNKHVFRIKEMSENAWRVLHDVSRSWMQLARKNLNKSVCLRLSTNPENDQFATTLNSRCIMEQSTVVIPHVKEVNIHFDNIVEEPNEEDLEKLGRIWPVGLIFLKARSLTCHLKFKCAEPSNNACYDVYFTWFIKRVRSSFPNLQEIKISFGGYGDMSISPGVLFSNDWDVGLFLALLFKAGMWDFRKPWNSACINDKNNLMNRAPGVTSFHCSACINGKFASWAIKRSAKTLEKLHYGRGDGGGFKAFMFDDDGQVIVYPRLRDLYVRDSSNEKGELTTDKSIVPFPVLQRLRVYCSCIFKDDTIFRGSNDTLISLDIGLHSGFVDLFQKHKVFLQGAYRNVLHITAMRERANSLILPADEFAVAAFGLVSPATQSVTINGEISYKHINSVIPACPYLENIQILSLEIERLSLLEVLNIIKHFPRMTDFGCRFQGIDSELDGIQDKVIPGHLGSQYSQLISRLKCWHAYSLGGVSFGDLGVLFVTLAVLCPNFTFVSGWRYSTAAYDSTVGYILSSGLYDEHAERLGHIFEPR